MANVKKPIIQTPDNSNKKISDKLVVHGDEIGYTSIYKIIQTLQHSIEEIQQNIEQIQSTTHTGEEPDLYSLYNNLIVTVDSLNIIASENKSAIDENKSAIDENKNNINDINQDIDNIYNFISNNAVVNKVDFEFLHNFSPFTGSSENTYSARFAAIFTYTIVVNLALTLYNKNVIDVSDIENIKTATQQGRLIDDNE